MNYMAREILFREAVIGFMSGGKIEPDMGFGTMKTTTQEKGIGHYCGGKEVEQCRSYFREGLDMVCATCPK